MFVCVYEKQIPNILGNCETFTENMGFLIVRKREITIYNFFNLVKDKLQLILNINTK